MNEIQQLYCYYCYLLIRIGEVKEMYLFDDDKVVVKNQVEMKCLAKMKGKINLDCVKVCPMDPTLWAFSFYQQGEEFLGGIQVLREKQSHEDFFNNISSSQGNKKNFRVELGPIMHIEWLRDHPSSQRYYIIGAKRNESAVICSYSLKDESLHYQRSIYLRQFDFCLYCDWVLINSQNNRKLITAVVSTIQSSVFQIDMEIVENVQEFIEQEEGEGEGEVQGQGEGEGQGQEGVKKEDNYKEDHYKEDHYKDDNSKQESELQGSKAVSKDKDKSGEKDNDKDNEQKQQDQCDLDSSEQVVLKVTTYNKETKVLIRIIGNAELQKSKAKKQRQQAKNNNPDNDNNEDNDKKSEQSYLKYQKMGIFTQQYERHQYAIWACKLSRRHYFHNLSEKEEQCKYLVVGDQVKNVYLYNFKDFSFIAKNLKAHSEGICEFSWLDHSNILSGSYDGTIAQINVHNFTDVVRYFEVFEKGSTIWRIIIPYTPIPNSFEQVKIVQPAKQESEQLNRKYWLICNSSPYKFQLLDPKQNKLVWENGSENQSLAYAADWNHRFLITGSFYDKSIALWDLKGMIKKEQKQKQEEKSDTINV